MTDFTLHNACIVRPKWRPWWMSGSAIHLYHNIHQSNQDANDEEGASYAFFRGPSCSASSLRRRKGF